MPNPDPPKLSDDPDLAAFFRAVDRGYGLAPPSKPAAPAPTGPQPIRERQNVDPIREGAQPQPSSIRADRVPLGQAPAPPKAPPKAPAPANPPQPSPAATTAPDPNLVALARVWHRLSERDRQELMWIALLKLQLGG